MKPVPCHVRSAGLMHGVGVGLLFAAVAGVSLFGWRAGRVNGATAPVWRDAKGGRAAFVHPARSEREGFRGMSSTETGIRFTNALASSVYLTNQIFLNGSGVAAGDVDGDGWCDLYFARLDGPNALYRNLGGWKFEDVTHPSGVACPDWPCTGVALADMDGDGDLDLLVNTIGLGTHLFLNDGRGRFARVEPGLNPGRGGMSFALADIDGDGDLDVYVVNYRATTLRDLPNTRFRGKNRGGVMVLETVNGRPVTEPDLEGRFSIDSGGRVEEHGEVDLLLRNEGAGRFTPVSFIQGNFLDEEGRPWTQPPYDWGLSAMFRDMNGDQAPDLYVCNDFASPDRVWINDGRGRFRAMARLALRHTSTFSMGVDFADFDRDGWDDFFVAEMLARHPAQRLTQVADVRPVAHPVGSIDDRPQVPHQNMLFRNRGDGTYAEIAWMAGVAASDWSWSPVFLDVDLDGYEDLLVTTGHELEMIDADLAERTERLRDPRRMSPDEQRRLRLLFPKLAQRNVAFRNRGNGTMIDWSSPWGFDHLGVSHGLALADLDRDGDLDVAVNNLNGPALLLRNESAAPRLAVQLRGLSPNTHGIGARIEVEGGPVRQSQEMISGGRYLSCDESLRVFAAGSTNRNLTVTVTWRDGRQTRRAGVAANQWIEMAETDAEARASAPPVPPQPWFEDVTDRIKHRHHENAFDDFNRQPLLPRRLSQSGPPVAWADMNGDGGDDLLIGGSRGGTVAVLLGDGRGGFSPWHRAELAQPLARDAVGLLAFPGLSGGVTLRVSESNWEVGESVGSSVRSWRFEASADLPAGPQVESSTGPLAAADVDGDGDLDLFVGGRAVPGRYPMAAPSRIWRRTDQGWLADTASDAVLVDAGLVQGAVWSDLTGDGWPELVLAVEWGPVRVYWNQRGQFHEVTRDWGLAGKTGWWQGVHVGDFDGDGRLDIVASNWGFNSRYQASPSSPRRLYYGENGAQLLETWWDAEAKVDRPDRSYRAVRAALSWVGEVATNHQAYAHASADQLFGSRSGGLRRLEVSTSASMRWLNRIDEQGRGGFEGADLPAEAQASPAFGVSVADFDGDGREDVFLSQNFFAVNADMPRLDAGRGLLLRGLGQGTFASVPSQWSGLQIDGEQRGAAVGDFDRDGRPDLVVTQNGAATRLFRNRQAEPGVRVRLKGPPGNPMGFGAVLWTAGAERVGPVREIHAGAGYASQDSAVPVLRRERSVEAVEVRWPGGRKTRSLLPAKAQEVVIAENGFIEVLR